ncbi:hypothetical protein ACWDUL_23900 [Nocardia niigatensis]
MEAAEPERPPGKNEREELTRLRRELAAPRGGSDGGDPVTGPEEKPPSARRRALRWTATAALLILVAVLAIGSVLARFAHGELLDTDRYVQTVEPLGTNPTLQSELADRITDAIMARVDVQNITAQALAAIAESNSRVPSAVVGVAPLVGKEARDFVRDTTQSVLASGQFRGLWIEANRQAHQGVAAVLRDRAHAAVGMSADGTVSVSIGPIIDQVRTALIARGFTFADRVPAIDRSFVLFRSPELVEARGWVSVLDRVAPVLPWITVLVAACAVWVAPQGVRRRATFWVGVALALAMALLAVALGVARSAYLDAVPAEVMSTPTAAVVIDVFLVPLRTTVRALFAVAVLIVFLGVLSGPSRSAVAVRAGYYRAVTALRSQRTDREPNAVESAVARFRGPLRGGIVALAVIVLIAWRYPTGLVVAGIVLAALAALFIVELAATGDRAHP